MKKLSIILLFTLLITGSICLAQYALPFYPHYWITGTVEDADDGTKADGHEVYFFKTLDIMNAGQYARGVVGPDGGAGKANRFLLNTFGLPLSVLEVGATYQVAVANDNPSNMAEGYGADPVSFTISGSGLDEVPMLKLAKGAGIMPPRGEITPTIKIWFNNRLYQAKLVARGEQFVVTNMPKLKVNIEIDEPSALASDISEYSIVIDPESAKPSNLDLTVQNIAKKVLAAGSTPDQEKLSALSLAYDLTEELSEGEHIFEVTAKSSGLIGPVTTATERAKITVLGGPARMIGEPVAFPSPFSKARDGNVTIQYQLSSDTAIEIIMIDASAKRIRNFKFEAGEEGGSAGVNKITWDGVSDRGTVAGNGIYVLTILARDDGRKLGSLKLTILH